LRLTLKMGKNVLENVELCYRGKRYSAKHVTELDILM
jgi:hypothetical protein